VSLLSAACGRRETPSPPSPLQAPPVDAARVTPADALTWRHRETTEVDLNGDGTVERLVVAADVQLSDSGAPLWEDGHRWAVFVADAPQPTLLYGAFVPNGHAEAAILNRGADGSAHVLVYERTPSRTRALVIAYEAPGRARAVSEANYQVERWVRALNAP